MDTTAVEKNRALVLPESEDFEDIGLSTRCLICSASKKSDEELDTSQVWQSLHGLYRLRVTFIEKLIVNNKYGLSKVYNEVINTYLKYPSIQYYIFCHDDLQISDLFFFEKIETFLNQYDVIGIAGSRKINFKSNPIAWHNTEREYWRGAVTHPMKEDKTKVYVNSYGFMPDEVATIDGCFIAVNRKVFDAGVRFNENYDFDFYDMAFSMNARIAGFKLGVVPIFCTHYSHGDGIMRLTYLDTQEKFKNEYRNKL